MVVMRASNGSAPLPTTTTAESLLKNSNGSSSRSPAAAGAGVDPTSGVAVGSQHQEQQGSDSGSDANNTWEEEIEETLKLVQLLPPSGETATLLLQKSCCKGFVCLVGR